MLRSFRARVLASSLLAGAASFALPYAPAIAQSADVSISFNTFHDRLAAHGDWVYSDRWGEVWTPTDVPNDFHPYGTAGHWANTDEYGWVWVSDYDWGDIPFHYGRWVNDPDDGWLWIPGYTWSPGWVVWRSGGNYTGWMPMPPDDHFLQGGTSVGIGVGGGGLSFSIDFNNTNDYYGYSRWYGRDYDENRFAANWTFVNTGHMGDRDYRRYEAPRNNYITIIHDTRNVTNYTIVNNYVVNRSVDVRDVQRAGGRDIQPVHASAVFKNPQFIATVDIGRQTEMRDRADRPRGTGEAGSAPKPPPQVIQSLSPKVKEHNGKPPAHLFSRDTVGTAPLAPPGDHNAPQGNGPGGNPPNGNPNGAADHGGNPTGHPGETPNANGPNPNGASDHNNNDHNNGANGKDKTDHTDHPGANMPSGTPGTPAPNGAVTPPTPETPNGHHDHTGPASGTGPSTNVPGAGVNTPPATETPHPDHNGPGTEPSTHVPAAGGNTPPVLETPRAHRDRIEPATPSANGPASGPANTPPTPATPETPRAHRVRTGPAGGQEPSPPPATDNKPGNPDAASHAGDTGPQSGNHGDKKDKKQKPDEPGAPPQ